MKFRYPRWCPLVLVPLKKHSRTTICFENASSGVICRSHLPRRRTSLIVFVYAPPSVEDTARCSSGVHDERIGEHFTRLSASLMETPTMNHLPTRCMVENLECPRKRCPDEGHGNVRVISDLPKACAQECNERACELCTSLKDVCIIPLPPCPVLAEHNHRSAAAIRLQSW